MLRVEHRRFQGPRHVADVGRVRRDAAQVFVVRRSPCPGDMDDARALSWSPPSSAPEAAPSSPPSPSALVASPPPIVLKRLPVHHSIQGHLHIVVAELGVGPLLRRELLAVRSDLVLLEPCIRIVVPADVFGKFFSK